MFSIYLDNSLEFFTVLRRLLKASADHSTQVFQGLCKSIWEKFYGSFSLLEASINFWESFYGSFLLPVSFYSFFKKLSLFTITTVSMKVLLGFFRSLGKTSLKLSSNFYKSLISIIVSFEEIFRTWFYGNFWKKVLRHLSTASNKCSINVFQSF